MKYVLTCDVQNWNCIIGKNPIETYGHTSIIIKHILIVQHCYNTNKMQCMIIYHQIHKAQPKKYQEKLKNPKIFEKPPNLGLKCMNAWKERRLEHLPSIL